MYAAPPLLLYGDTWLDPLSTIFGALADLLEPQLRRAAEGGAQQHVDALATIPVRGELPQVCLGLGLG